MYSEVTSLSHSTTIYKAPSMHQALSFVILSLQSGGETTTCCENTEQGSAWPGEIRAGFESIWEDDLPRDTRSRSDGKDTQIPWRSWTFLGRFSKLLHPEIENHIVLLYIIE